jgi:hypothetical protein
MAGGSGDLAGSLQLEYAASCSVTTALIPDCPKVTAGSKLMAPKKRATSRTVRMHNPSYSGISISTLNFRKILRQSALSNQAENG